MSITTIVFCGQFDIENDDFTLNAKRFILRGKEISFVFEGCDEYGKFIIEGVAVKTEHGFFMAPRQQVKYLTYDSDDVASIKIETASLTEKKTICKVNGSWIQNGESWKFSGSLNKFKA